MHTVLLLDMMADAAPDRLAFGGRSEALTFAEARQRARRGSLFLLERGGAQVAFVGQNGVTLPVALFSAGIAGRPFAPLNYRLPDADLTALVARTAPCVAIVDDEMISRLGDCPGVTLVARSAFDAACSVPADDLEQEGVERDIAVLLFTSGTTGVPKAAILRHANLTAYVISTVDFLSADEDEAALVSVPPYHIAGISAILTGVYGGRRLVYLEAFSPEQWVDAVVVETITHAMIVPTMLGRILDCLERQGRTLPSLKALSYGGGRMPQPVIERAMRLLPHVDFVNAYGLTETSSTIALLSPGDHRAALESSDSGIRRRLGSVGRPLSTLELEIRGPDGASLPPGSSGEIYVRGDQVSGEYAGKKPLGDDGWFATNDGGWMDEDGYLFVEGRLDDVIVRGGENISPGEIEDVLRGHPQVIDVAVLGMPDDEWGEKVACVLVLADPQPTSEALSSWVRSKLRSTKTPAVWLVREALPYNDTGKLLRRQLKAELSGKDLNAPTG